MTGVFDDPQDAGAEVIAVGREPAEDPGRGGWSRLVIICETAALLALIALALHYRAEAVQQHGRRLPPSSPRVTAMLPNVASGDFRLPAEAGITGAVLITSAGEPGAGRAQFVLSAVISGARPDTAYFLTGNDCSVAAPLPDHVWASGYTDASGRAVLTGHAWTGAVADEYWLWLTPLPANPPPGLHGRFAQGAAAKFPAGQAPCAPSP